MSQAVTCHRKLELKLCKQRSRVTISMLVNKLGISFHSLGMFEKFTKNGFQPVIEL